MRTSGRMRLTALLAAASLALTGCGFKGLYNVSLPGGTATGHHPYEVTIEFRNVLDLVPQSNVKVNDVAVGRVVKIKLDGWYAQVTIKLDGRVNLPENSRAEVRMTSLLGEKFVALDPPLGEPEGKLHNGSFIPLTSTGTAPEVEEVLSALSLLLNGGGLEQLRTITTELNKALKGNEVQVRDLVDQLNIFVGGLDKQKQQITDAVTSINKLAATLAQNKKTLGDAIDTFPKALTILNQDRTKLVNLLSSLSQLGSVATDVITQTQEKFVRALKSLSPVLDALANAGTDLPNSLKLLLTYPFPIGKTLDIVKGDYANLNAFLDFNLDENLCGVSSILCALKSLGSDKAFQPATSTARQLPAIPGLGG